MIITYINDIIESIIHIPPISSGSGSNILFNDELTEIKVIIDENDANDYYYRCVLALDNLPCSLKKITFIIKKNNKVDKQNFYHNSKYSLDYLKNKLKIPFDCELVVFYN